VDPSQTFQVSKETTPMRVLLTGARHESVIGSQFDARVEATTTVGPYDAVVPSIAGRAWITSFNQLMLDPTDPFQEGFVVGRPWQPKH
jgi:proline racemase